MTSHSLVTERVETENAIRMSATATAQHKITCRENIWLYFCCLQDIFDTVVDLFRLSPEDARKAIGGEYHSKFPNFMGHNPFRQIGHCLPKSGKSTSCIYNKWQGHKRLPIFQSYPDLAIKDPAPVRIVFDAKYFTGGDAELALVEGMRELAYYRGLPKSGEGGSLYDFGCLLAYDASKDGALFKKWHSIEDKDFFWRSSNIKPIILREAPL